MCRAWSVTICSLTPAPVCCISRSHPLVHFGRLCACAKHWVVDWCVFYRLSVTKCLCGQCLRCPFSRVREILWFLFAKCGTFCPPCFPFSMILTLLWMEHTYCTVGHALSSPGPALNPLYMLKLCAEKTVPVCRQLEFGVFSPGQGWDEVAIHFCSLYSAPYWDFGGL